MATFASVGVAIVLIVAKFGGWWITYSVSLQASLIDSLLDAVASIINMFAVWHALRPADREHRYGHGKAESLAGLGQSVFIGFSALWLLHEVYERFTTPEIIQDTGVGLVVMAFAIVVTLLLVSFQNYVVKRTGSTAIAADMLHYRSDLLINLAVIVSLIFAHWLKINFLDPVFGLIIGIYILWTAWKIIVQAFEVLMDAELSDREREKIIKLVLREKKIIDVWDLRTRTSGLHKFFELAIVLDPTTSVEQGHKLAEEAEARIKKQFDHSQVLIRLVPSTSDPSHIHNME